MPTEPWTLAALVGVGLAAGFINVVAGGGSLLTVPLLIFLGLPETVANGTSRVAIFVQNASAITKYRREGRLDGRMLRTLVPPVLVGAALGAFVATRISDATFRAVLVWVMLGCAVFVVFEPKRLYDRAKRGDGPRLGAARVWPTLLVIGFYGGLVQAGVGYLVLAALTLVLGMQLVEANILKVVLVFAYTPIALAIFFADGLVAFVPALALSVGQALGGWLGAAATLRRGERLIRALLVVAVVASAVKLLWP